MRSMLMRFVRFIQVILGFLSRASQSRDEGQCAHPKDVTFIADDEPTRRFSVPLMRTTYSAFAPRSH